VIGFGKTSNITRSDGVTDGDTLVIKVGPLEGIVVGAMLGK
jgi:hypothetical protein